MVHKRGSQSAAFHTAGRNGWLDVRNEIWRWFRPAGQLPAEEIQKTAGLRSIRIVEVLSVKMFRKFRGAQLFLRLIVPLQTTDPDVAEPYFGIVVL